MMNKFGRRLTTLFLATLMTGPMLCRAQESQTVISAQSRHKWWAPRHDEKLEQAAAGKAELVMIGDSITHYWEKQRDYEAKFSKYNTLNLGFGGDRTQNVLWRLQNGEVDGISPKLVTIMIGTNNSRRDKPEDIFAGIKAIVAELHQRLPESKIAVLSIFPRKPSLEYETVKAVNAMLPQLTDNQQVFHVDINKSFLDENGAQRTKLFNRDLLHLSSEGYETWSKALESLLAESSLKARTSKPVIRLWPIEMVGGEQNRLKEVFRQRRGKEQLCGIKDPTLTVYQAEKTEPTPAIVYCPGGAYKVLGPDTKVIQWLNQQGITVFMLKYTIPDDRQAAFKDVQRAMRVVRLQAEKWNINPANIGVIGQSAGGHLVARLSQNYDKPAYQSIDDADKQSCQPNFTILISAAYFLGLADGPELAKKGFNFICMTEPTMFLEAKLGQLNEATKTKVSVAENPQIVLP